MVLGKDTHAPGNSPGVHLTQLYHGTQQRLEWQDQVVHESNGTLRIFIKSIDKDS
jgi:hypothetical protein